MKKALMPMAMAAIFLSAPALADNTGEGTYLKVFLGASGADDPNEKFPTGTFPGGGVNDDFSTGIATGLVGGYDFGEHFRAELEFSFRHYGLDRELFAPGGAAPGFFADENSGAGLIFGFMANGYYDMPLDERWEAYIGVGIGGAIQDIDGASYAGILQDNMRSHGAFAWQAMLGVSYQINDRVSIGTEYRYFDTTYDLFGENHSGLISLRYNLY